MRILEREAGLGNEWRGLTTEARRHGGALDFGRQFASMDLREKELGHEYHECARI